jgi:hypothetical protein
MFMLVVFIVNVLLFLLDAPFVEETLETVSVVVIRVLLGVILVLPLPEYGYLLYVGIDVRKNMFFLIYHFVCFLLSEIASPYFASFYLLLLVRNVDAVSQIFHLIVSSKKILGSYVLLITIIILTFSHFVAGFYSGLLTSEDGSLICSSYLSCFLALLWAVPAGCSPLPTWGNMEEVPDTLFMLGYWGVVTLILMAVFLGIIVDYLEDERGKKASVSSSREELCAVCRLDRSSIVGNGYQFDEHIGGEHNGEYYIWLFFGLLIERASSRERERKGSVSGGVGVGGLGDVCGLSGTEDLIVCGIGGKKDCVVSMFPLLRTFGVERKKGVGCLSGSVCRVLGKEESVCFGERSGRIRNYSLSISAVKELQTKLSQLESAINPDISKLSSST